MNESDSFMDTNILNEKYKSPLTDSQISLTALTKSLSSDNKVIQSPTVVNVLNKKVEGEEGSPKVDEPAIIPTDEKMLKSPKMNTESKMSDKSSAIIHTQEKILKSPLINTVSKKSDKVLKNPIAVDEANDQIVIDASKSLNSEKILKKPMVIDKVRRTSADQKSKSPAVVEARRKTSVDKISKCLAPAVLENTLNNEKDTIVDSNESLNSDLEEKKSKKLQMDKENSEKKICSLEKTEEISSTSKESRKSSESDLQTLSDIENIDFLLEKSYNEQRTKSKASFKRKIDNLLKMKQSKACKLSSDDDLQNNKAALDINVTKDSASISCSKSLSVKKNNTSESIITEEENTVNSANSEDKDKIVLASNSEQKIDCNKADQSLEEAQKSKSTESDAISEIVALPTSVPFSNFPDIPTELLKNILDKHRTNLNQSSNIDLCLAANQLSNLKTENMKLSDQDDINCNIINDEKDISSGSSSALDSEAIVLRSDTQENSVKDCGNTTNVNQGDSQMDTENVTKNNCSAKMTPFMENLQKLLKCFTEKGPAFEELKKSKTLKTLPAYSLKSTLKLYHVLNEHHKNDNVLNSSNVNNNSLPDFPPETVSSGYNKSSICNHVSTNAFAHSKNDNLEIMDMDVDSDDDNAK